MPTRVLALRSWPLVARVAGVLALVVAMLLLAVAAFPWGVLFRTGFHPLAAALGRPVTVGSVRRIDRIGFVPTVEFTDVHVAQPAWVGGGDMARIGRVRVRIPVLPLLFGHARPHAIDVDGLRLALVRDAAGRDNWSSERKGSRPTPPDLRHLTVSGGRVTLDDRGRHVRLAGTLVSDAAHGLAVDAGGTLRGRPLRLAVRGAALGDADPRKPYPLRVVARAPQVTLDARAMLDAPLFLRAFTADVRAGGRDLSDLDDLLQAGLFPTQRFALEGRVRRDGDRWRIARLAGRVGRSELVAALTVARRGDRTRLDGDAHAARFDFADFASDAQQARAAARERATGKRVFPATDIRLAGLARLDGALRFRADALIGAAPFRSLAASVTLDHRLLRLDPLASGLSSGMVTGTARVDARGRVPALALDLHLIRATVQGLLVPSGAIAGPLEARVRLAGHGDTIRAALGAASGTVGLSVAGGTMRRDYATFAGGDVVRSAEAAMGAGSARVALRCLAGTLRAQNGRVVPAPLVLDTAVARADARGAIDLRTETLDLVFDGRSKQPALIQSATPVRLFGTLSAPEVDIRPPRVRSSAESGALDRVGFFLKKLRVRTGDAPRDRPAPDADCAALERAALR